MAKLTYKEFIARGMREMDLKGAGARVVRDAMKALAAEWVRRKVRNPQPKVSAAQVADKLLGKR